MNTTTIKFKPEVIDNFKYLFSQDFSAHNEMVWMNEEKRRCGEDVRNKVIVGFNVRVILADPRTNPEGYSFEEMYSDPEVHGEMMLRMAAWTRSKTKFDWEMGLPDQWVISPYAANVHEDSLLGAEVLFPGGYEVPATRPHFIGEKGYEEFMEYPFVSMPNQGHMRMIHETYLSWKEKCDRGWEYLGRPVIANPAQPGTDGPFTIACNTFGPQDICLLALDDPERFHLIMNRNIELIIQRIKDYSALYGNQWVSEEVTDYGFADDMIALISSKTYIDLVLPYHKKLIHELAPNADSYSIHLCGNASRHFKVLKDELNIMSFDTGFPINFDNLRDELGDEVLISGGPKCNLFLEDKKELVKETVRISNSATALNGPFVMREGNNLPPLVPDDNLEAFYAAATM